MLRSLVTHHPMAAFVAFACGFSWVIGWPLQVQLARLLGSGDVAALYAMRLPVVAGPAVAAVLVASMQGGWPALRAWGHSLWPQRVPWLFALGSAAVVGLVSVFALQITGASLSWMAATWPLWLAHLAGQVIVVGAFEEAGWRGWLLPHTLAEYAPMHATVITTACWVMWHLPALWWAGGASALALLALCVGLSATLSLIHLRSRSVLVCALAHGAANTPLFFAGSVAPEESPLAAMGIAGMLYLLLALAWWRRA